MKVKIINFKAQSKVVQQASNKVIGNLSQLSERNTYKNSN
jgi:hypothetical protein